ncbi:MAG: hypothetical protein ACOY3Z_11290 [Thermodesulfobacteriota bacterium]
MALDTQGMVEALFHGILLREPTASEADYWQDQLDLALFTPAGMAFDIAASTEFLEENLMIAAMFQAAFGRYATNTELMAWRAVYDTGMDLAGIGQAFIRSSEFRESAASASTTDFLAAMASNGLGRAITADELALLVPLVDSGAINYGNVLQAIIQMNGRVVEVGLAMLFAGLNGVAPEEADIAELSDDLPVAVSAVVTNSVFYVIPTGDFFENAGYLELSGEFTESLAIDLYGNTFTIGGTAQVLAYGSMADVASVNAAGVSGANVVFTGGIAAETYVASDEGDSITGGGGADTLHAGGGVDTFVFESSAFLNGIDTIHDFTRGAENDVLDFSSFLGVADASYSPTMRAEGTDPYAWENGDILVVSGYGLTTAADIVDLFGDNKPFALPTTASKVVLISADVVGDATVWYILNQTSTSSIEAAEISKVAVLAGVNSLDVVGFDTVSTSDYAEDGGYLGLTGALAGELVLDLDSYSFTINGVAQSLAYGTLADVVSVDATGISGAAAAFTGGSVAETYAASAEGDTITGGGGNDSLQGGAAADTFVFEATAVENGVDAIEDFQVGASGDVLDFSAFLNVTDASGITTRSSTSTAAVAWGNGDVLVVSGYGLTSASAIASLFGVGKTFAAPSAAGKVVVITADIVGDATVWYIVNQTAVTTIEAAEVSSVAVLTGVNNLGLAGFDTGNFA